MKRSVTNLRYCFSICLEGLRKTTKIYNQGIRFAGQDLNPGHHEYDKATLLFLRTADG
jgi:hypothetical protein